MLPSEAPNANDVSLWSSPCIQVMALIWPAAGVNISCIISLDTKLHTTIRLSLPIQLSVQVKWEIGWLPPVRSNVPFTFTAKILTALVWRARVYLIENYVDVSGDIIWLKLETCFYGGDTWEWGCLYLTMGLAPKVILIVNFVKKSSVNNWPIVHWQPWRCGLEKRQYDLEFDRGNTDLIGDEIAYCLLQDYPGCF